MDMFAYSTMLYFFLLYRQKKRGHAHVLATHEH